MISLPYTGLLTLVAMIAGVVLLIAFRTFSDRLAVALAKRQIWAQLYALRLYADEPSVIWQIQKRLFAWNGRYLLQMFRPAAIVVPPLFGLLFVLDGFYGHRPLRTGESTLVRVHSQNQAPSLTGEGVVVATPPLRIPAYHAVYWRISATDYSGSLVFGALRKHVRTGPGLAYISACSGCFGNPIEVQYPPAYLDIFGYRTRWLVWFLIVSATTMLALRNRFGAIF